MCFSLYNREKLKKRENKVGWFFMDNCFSQYMGQSRRKGMGCINFVYEKILFQVWLKNHKQANHRKILQEFEFTCIVKSHP